MIITRYGGQTWLNRRVTPISCGQGIDNPHILWYHILVDTTGGRCIEYASGLMCRTMPPECYRVSYFSHALLAVVLTFSHCQVLRFSFQPARSGDLVRDIPSLGSLSQFDSARGRPTISTTRGRHHSRPSALFGGCSHGKQKADSHSERQ